MRDGNLYARGATDDKGQMLTHVQERRGLAQDRAASCRCKLKFLIEGEEEVGSENLDDYLAAEANARSWPATAS